MAASALDAWLTEWRQTFDTTLRLLIERVSQAVVAVVDRPACASTAVPRLVTTALQLASTALHPLVLQEGNSDEVEPHSSTWAEASR